jgi:predicted aldo/keto reductase-like oxidoreductase
MKYRKFDKIGEDMSLLGIGTMRLPTIEEDGVEIDEERTIELIRSGIDQGINYVDTAYMYHDGASEVVVGKALKDGYREKVLLADKMPVWFAEKPEDQQKIFDEQLNRCDTDYFDLYLVHNITEQSWKRVLEFKTIDFVTEMQAQGKVGKIGFSYHGQTPEFFKEVLDYYDWDFCQIQLNYMDTHIQAGLEGLKYAGSKNIPVVIMEPLKGGKLTDNIPDSIQDYWNQTDVKRSPAEWGLRWVSDHPEVMTILSGVHNMEQLEENIRILSDAEPNSLNESELEIIDKVGEKYNQLIPYSCTSCRYCMPCPNKVSIPEIIGYRNEWELFNHNLKIKRDYDVFVPPKRRGSACIECGECEEKCPQHLPIIKIMKEATDILE